MKVWGLSSSTPHFTLEGREGHTKGVNCVCYYGGGDKPYLVSGGDDRKVKVWDYVNKSCVQTLEAHHHNVAYVFALLFAAFVTQPLQLRSHVFVL